MIENYLLGGEASPLADRYSESVIATVVETLPKLLIAPDDVAARGDLMWASTLALNDYQVAGRQPSQFVLHSMEHALSAFQPDLAHGRGLATLYPAYFRWLLENGRAEARFAQLGRRIFGLDGEGSALAAAFIERFEQWLGANGLLQTLEEVGIHESDYAAISDYAVRVYGDGRQLQALGSLSAASIVEIFQATAKQTTVR